MSTNTEDKWKFQDDIVEVLKKMDKKGDFSTIVELPTGSGKTRVAISFIKEMAEDDVKFLWLTDSIELLLQSIISFMPEKDNIPEDYIIPEVGKFQLLCGSQTKRCKSIGISGIKSDTKILFASPRTLRKIRESESKEFRDWVKCNKLYIIYDEAHHIGADSAIDVFRSILLKNQTENNVSYNDCIKKYGLIGLTATVYRGDKVMDVFNHWFKYGYDGNKITHDDSALEESTANELRNTIKITDIDTLIADGVLVAPTFERRETAKGNAEKENVLIDDIRANHKSWGKTVVFVNDIEMAHNVVEKLKKDKIKIFEYTSGTKDYKRLKDFKEPKSESDIMVTVDVVSEGFDVKDIETVYLFSGVVSPIRIRQRVGRVLRSVDKGTKKATVIWQDYGDGYLNPEIEYRKPIDPVFRSKLYYESTYHFWRVLDLFSLTELAEGVGHYTIKEDLEDEIYVNKDEHIGFERLYTMIMIDSIVLQEKPSFTSYAKYFNLTEDGLYNYIKEICFGVSSSLYKKNLTRRKIKEQEKIYVTNEQIKLFFEYVVNNDFYKPKYTPEIVNEDKNGKSDSELDEDTLRKLVAKYDIDKQPSYKEAIKKLEKAKYDLSVRVRPKSYTSGMKITADGKKFYNFELESCRQLLKFGCYYDKEEFELKEDGYPSAYIGKSEDGTETRPLLFGGKLLHRKNATSTPPVFLVARALVTRINNIMVSDDDVRNYIKAMKKINGGNEKLAKEQLVALGFEKNEDILRAQCIECKKDGKIPAILQYVIYEKAYEKIYPEVSYKVDGDEEGYVQFEIQNKQKLDDIYKKLIEGYGLEVSDIDLVNPVADIIFDYRPYIKVIKNYQGIKPEFLTRMTSNVFSMGKTPEIIVSGFGGSGAGILNFIKNDTQRLVYNDFGYLNTNFYNVIKDNKMRSELLKTIEQFCDAVFNGEEDFFNKIISKCDMSVVADLLAKNMEAKKKQNENKELSPAEINAIREKAQKQTEILQQSCKSIFDDYVEHSKKNVDAKGKSGIEKLDEIDEKYKTYITELTDDVLDCRKAEEVLYGFHKKLQFIFTVTNTDKKCEIGLSDIDYAFLFLIVEGFSDRYFFDGCDIINFANFYANYEHTINTVGDYVAKYIDVKCSDALELMKDEKLNTSSTDWILDIPYSQTDDKTYSGCINENEFMRSLDNIQGGYSVNSRFNICLSSVVPDLINKLGEEKKDINYAEVIETANQNEMFLARKKAIYEFYTRFTTKAELEEINKNILDANDKRYYLSDSNKATYIFIPYVTNIEDWSERLLYDEKNQEVIKNKKQRRLNDVITREGIIRMLAGTLYSNLPIEITVTNIDATKSNKPIYWFDEEDKIGVIPTFKTGVNNYNADASVIVLKYDLYMELLRNLLFRKEFEEYEAKTYAASFREYYKQDR